MTHYNHPIVTEAFTFVQCISLKCLNIGTHIPYEGATTVKNYCPVGNHLRRVNGCI